VLALRQACYQHLAFHQQYRYLLKTDSTQIWIKLGAQVIFYQRLQQSVRTAKTRGNWSRKTAFTMVFKYAIVGKQEVDADNIELPRLFKASILLTVTLSDVAYTTFGYISWRNCLTTLSPAFVNNSF